MFVDPTAIQHFNSRMTLVKINAEKDTVVARKYKVSGYPTMVLTDKKGEEIDRIVGYLPTEPFLKTLVDYQNGIGTLADLVDSAKTADNRQLYFDIADKFKYRGGTSEAELWYGRVVVTGPAEDSLSGQARLAVADMYRREKNWDKSIALFGAISREYPDPAVVAEADIMTAVTVRQSGDTARAISLFEDFLKKHPTSTDTSYARKQIENLKAKPKEGTK